MTCIAVSAQGEGPAAKVDPRFGRAQGFALFTPSADGVGEGAWTHLSNAQAQSQGHGAGLAAAEVLARVGVTVVLSGAFGPKATSALKAAGIRFVEGMEGRTVGEAVEVYLQSEARS